MPRKNNNSIHRPYSTSGLFCVKKRFKTEKEAQDAAEFQMLEHMSLELSVYKCESCKYWHLTRNVKDSFGLIK